MPKEVTYDEACMYDVIVAWQPDKYVQVGIETHDGEPVAEKLWERGLPPNVTVTGSNLTDAQPESFTLARFTGLWGTFDRDGVNRLIRALRRARDQAYGKDE